MHRKEPGKQLCLYFELAKDHLNQFPVKILRPAIQPTEFRRSISFVVHTSRLASTQCPVIVDVRRPNSWAQPTRRNADHDYDVVACMKKRTVQDECWLERTNPVCIAKLAVSCLRLGGAHRANRAPTSSSRSQGYGTGLLLKCKISSPFWDGSAYSLQLPRLRMT